MKSLNLSYQSGTLCVTGQLPSYYLKQVLQTALQDVTGVDRVDNRVDVVSSRGLNDVPSDSKNEETSP